MMSFSNIMDCYLYPLGNQLGITHIYLNFFASLLIPIGFLVIIFIIHYIGNRHNYYYRSYFLKTLFLVVQLFFAPSIFQAGLRLVTCRKVGSTSSFITANMLYPCYTTEYYILSVFVIGPLIFLASVAVPIVLLLSVYQRKKRRVSIKTYQYILGDYKTNRYYWEFIRYMEKLLIVMISVFFLQDLKAKALLISSILLVYGVSVFFMQPYKTDILNRLELFTTSVLFVSFQLALLAYERGDTAAV